MRWAVRLTKPVLMLISFVLSLVLYLYVTAPIEKRTVELSVHAMTPPGFDFDREGDKIDFTATGPRDKLEQLDANLSRDPQYVRAIANLTNLPIKSGVDKVDIENVHLIVQAPQDLGVEFKQDKLIRGVVERPIRRTAKIEVHFENPPTPGSWSDYDKDSFEVIPPSVVLAGPSEEVKTATLSVVINPQDVERNRVVTVPLTIPYGLKSSPEIDHVDVRPIQHQRQAYVNVTFLGHPAPGYSVSNYYVVTPTGPSSTAFIRGPAGVVDRTPTISATVDISGLKRGFTFSPTPVLPRQLELVDAPLRIRVDVQKTRQ